MGASEDEKENEGTEEGAPDDRRQYVATLKARPVDSATAHSRYVVRNRCSLTMLLGPTPGNVHPIDHHPNARAHGLAAERLAPFVEQLVR